MKKFLKNLKKYLIIFVITLIFLEIGSYIVLRVTSSSGSKNTETTSSYSHVPLTIYKKQNEEGVIEPLKTAVVPVKENYDSRWAYREFNVSVKTNEKGLRDNETLENSEVDIAFFGDSFTFGHGDGIVRAEFIPIMIGEKNYELLKEVKQVFDPNNIFNPGKIVDAAKMDTSLRYEIGRKEPEIKTLFDFSDSQGILRAAEKCNGSGDCRKPASFSGAMCPSYRATKDEKDTTRARANALREFLTQSDKENKFDHKELKEVFDLCLSCKA